MQNDPPSQLEERLQGHAPGDSHPTAPHTRPRRLKRGDEEPFAMVVLPSKPSGRHSKPLPPPGGAQRVVNGPPVPPPRPEHTLSSRSRPIVAKPVESGTGIRNNNNNNTTATPGSGIMELVSLPARTTVTLTTPRCEAEREKNLYTEAPQKVLPQHQHQTPLLSVIQNQPVTAAVTAVTAAGTANLKKKVGSGGLVSELDDLVILSEPNKQSSESIFCQNCGKCKCEACCRPRKLPQKWLCSGTFLCSKTTVVDALSCMCCVKGLFYHCTKDLDDEEAVVTDGVTDEEQPCSCQGPHVIGKWAAMTMLIPVLPCLLTYPLLGACAQCAEQVYARVTASGCQCQKVHKASNQESLSSRPMLCSSVSTHARTQSKSP